MKFSTLAVAGATILCAAAVHAQPVDPLWKKTVEQLRDAKNWVPQDIEFAGTDRTVAAPAGRTLNRSHLSGWSKGAPVYEVVQVEPKPLPGKEHEVDTFDPQRFIAMGQSLMVLEAATQRSDGQSLDGGNWTLFQISKSKMGYRADLKLWVDPLSGCPHRTETRMHAPLTIDLVTVVEYLARAPGECIERASTVDVKSLVPFSSQDVLIVSTASNWVARPPQ